jgi:hypothetical protein
MFRQTAFTLPGHASMRIERDLLTQLDDERALLVGLSADAEAYRLRYRPTFTGGVDIRIARDGPDIFIEVESFRFEHGPRPRQRVSPADWARLLDALGDIKFFSMPEHDEDARGVLDGIDWTIEGHRPRRAYRNISRLCPEPGFEKVGQLFFELAGCAEPDIGP